MKMNVFTGIAAGFLTLASPVWAEITSQDVVGLIQKMYNQNGVSLTIGSETTEGDTLILNDTSITFNDPAVSVEGTIDWIKLKETSDGTVEVTTSPRIEFAASAVENAGPPFSLTAVIEISDSLTVLSGSMDDLSVKSNAKQVDFSIGDIAVGSLKLAASFNLSGTDLASSSVIKGFNDDWRIIEANSSVGALGLNFDFTIPGDEGFMNGSLDLQDLDLELFASVPDFVSIQTRVEDGENPMVIAQELAELVVGYDITTGALNYGFTMDVDRVKIAVNGSQQSAEGGVEMSSDLFGYGFSNKGGEVNVVSSDIPVPLVQVKYDEIAFDIEVPLVKTETPEDSSLYLALRGIEVNDAIWAMIDPQTTLPRDPATAILDISGKVNVLFDLQNIESSVGLIMMGNDPAEMISLDVNELLVTAAGAKLEGNGAFVFDNDDLETFNGLPLPVGSVDLSLKGGFGLLDKLMALGLVPQEAAFGMRAMLAAFAKPGDGDDHFVSTIELTPEGAVMANGQRIK